MGGKGIPRAEHGAGRGPGLSRGRPRPQCGAVRPWPHLQHHSAERLPVGAHVQVHQRVPGGSGGAAGAAAATGAGRREAQRRGARDRAQAEQAGAAAQSQHSDAGRRGRVGSGRVGPGGSRCERRERPRRSRAPGEQGPTPPRAAFIGPAGSWPRPCHAPSGPVRGRPLAASVGNAAEPAVLRTSPGPET